MKVIIVGGGVSGLFCAYQLIKENISVELYEKESTLGKKFLVAGKSGLNITSDYPMEKIHHMYFKNEELFQNLLQDFSPHDTKLWLKELGVKTFTGSSFKVFPNEFKGADLLKRIKDFLFKSKRFELFLNSKLIDFDQQKIYFENKTIEYDKAIFAFGGASWQTTGSDGKWLKTFENKKIKVSSFTPSNCGLKTKLEVQERLPLKNIAIAFEDKKMKGEALLYNKGIEGGVIYHLSSYIRDSFYLNKESKIGIDFFPDLNLEDLIKKLQKRSHKKSWSNYLKGMLKIDPRLFELIKGSLSKEDYFDPTKLSEAFKEFNVKIVGIDKIDKAISTDGGVHLSELNEDFSLKSFRNIHLCGEMLDWEAPTGGFLFQGCFAIGYRIVSQIKKGRSIRLYPDSLL